MRWTFFSQSRTFFHILRGRHFYQYACRAPRQWSPALNLSSHRPPPSCASLDVLLQEARVAFTSHPLSYWCVFFFLLPSPVGVTSVFFAAHIGVTFPATPSHYNLPQSLFFVEVSAALFNNVLHSPPSTGCPARGSCHRGMIKIRGLPSRFVEVPRPPSPHGVPLCFFSELPALP